MPNIVVKRVNRTIKINVVTRNVTIKHLVRNINVQHVGRRGAPGENGQGIIPGGLSGQILTKASDTDYDMEWTSAGAGDMLSSVYDPNDVASDAFDMDNMNQGLTNKYVTSSDLTKLANTSGVNTGDQTSVTGNAGTATKLAIARNINGVAFDGTANITIIDATKVPTTRTVNGHALSSDVIVTKGDVGLGNADNTSDLNKPISTATQTALNAKANTSSLATVATSGDYDDLSNKPTIPAQFNPIAGTNISLSGTYPNVTFNASGGGGGGSVDSVNGQTGVVVLDADDIDDTSTTNKFVTSDDLTTISNTSGTNTGDQTLTGLGGVPTTRTINGTALSSNITLTQDNIGDGTTYKQYSQTEKTKLSGIATGAEVNVNADWNSISGDSQILNKPTLGTAAAENSIAFATAAQGILADSAIQDLSDLGITASSTELNYIDGVTSAIQTQIDSKAPSASPTFTGTVSGITSTMVGLGNVDNTSNATERAATAVLTNKDLTSVTNTFPTFNQSTTGSAATLTTGRTIGTATGDVTSAGSSFNGSANNTNAYTLATVNSNVGSFGSATQVSTVTVNAKGLVTAASNTSIQIAEGQVTNLTTDLASKIETVYHGSTSSTARPSTTSPVMWVGTVEPTNAINNDCWIDQT